MEGVERHARRRSQGHDSSLGADLHRMLAQLREQHFRDVHGLRPQRGRKMNREFVATQAIHLAIMFAGDFLEGAAHGQQNVIALAVTDVVVDVFEVIEIDEGDRAFFARLECSFDFPLQTDPVGQPGKRIVGREILDLDGGALFLGAVTRRAANAHHPAIFVERDLGIDSDPTFFAVGTDESGDVILDLAVFLEVQKEAAIGHMRRLGFEIEQAAPDQCLRLEAEDVLGSIVEVGEATLRVGGPHQIVRGFDQVSIAALALEQKLDDPAFLLEGLASMLEFVVVLVERAAKRRRGKAVDDLLGVAPVPTIGAARHQDPLGIPAAQFLNRHSKLIGYFLDAVLDAVFRHFFLAFQGRSTKSSRFPRVPTTFSAPGRFRRRPRFASTPAAA